MSNGISPTLAEKYDADSEPNWQGWALDMCSLLDRIEAINDDCETVKELCRGRFELAAKHGLTVQIIGPASGMDQ